MLTPSGMWLLFSLVGTNNATAIVVAVAVFAIALIITFPHKKSAKIVRLCLCLAVVFLAAFQVVRTMDFGGSFYGEWQLVRDSNIRGFNIANSPNTVMYFFEDGTLLKTENDKVTEHTWRISPSATRQILVVSDVPYEYRFSHFGRRLTLELGGERPRIPHMTTLRELQIVFRR